MAKIEFHHLFISHYRSIICALCSSLSASPPPLAGIKFKLDTDVDSLCHPSVALSLSLSLARFLSLSLSLPIARRTRVPADAFLSRAPPFTLSLALTLSNSLHLSPTLLFPHTHAHLHTHGIVNKAGEQGTLGDQGNRGPRRRRVTHTGPPHHFIWTLGKFEEIVLCVSFGCFFNCRFIAGYGVSIVTTDIYLKDFWTLYLNCHPCAP